MDYQLGSDTYVREEKPLPPTPAKEDSPTEESQAKPADEDFTWSDSTTSDMLF